MVPPRRFGRVVLVLFLVASLVGCGGTAQQVVGAGLIAGGIGIGIYGVAITPTKCTETRGLEALNRGDCNDPRDVRPGDPRLGVPLLITSAVMIVTGGVLMLTAHPHHDSGAIH